ncbi:hypothetical protein [Photobacterium aquimaris]|nr:hypothetical protein [Photobacterium aquimaris]
MSAIATFEDTKNFYQNSLIAPYMEDVSSVRLSVTVPRPSFLFDLNSPSKKKGLRKLVSSDCSLIFGQDFFSSLYSKYRSYVGMVRHSPKKLKVFTHLFCYLLDCYDKQKVCVLARSSASYDGRVAASVADFFESEGLAHNIIGYSYDNSDENGNASSIIPTQLFIEECTRHNVVYSLKNDIPFIEVRDDEKQSLDIDLIKKEDKKNFNMVAKPVRNHNKLWLNHTATLNGFELSPFAKRIFNKDLEHGGRFYCPFQNMPSSDRDNILIDGEKTVELDFKAIHINILYSLANKQLKGDPYLVDGIERKVMKSLMLRLVNSESISGFKAIITKSGNPKNKAIYAQYCRDLLLYDQEKTLANEYVKPRNPFPFENYIPGIPDDVTGDDVYKIITDKHHVIAHMFGADLLGTRLQNIDSNIMAEILMNLAKQGIPALPVHDSVIVKESDQAIANDVMKKAYFKIMKHDIDVTTK